MSCAHAPLHVCWPSCPVLQVGIFQVLYLNRTPEDAYAPLAPKGPYMPFRDASCGIPTFNLQPIDCIRVRAHDACRRPAQQQRSLHAAPRQAQQLRRAAGMQGRVSLMPVAEA